jgi:dCTP deaminase
MPTAMTRSADLLTSGSSEPVGVLPDHLLERAVQEGIITACGSGIPSGNVQPASLDLRLGPVAYRLRCSFLPHRHPVERRMESLVMGEVDLTRGDAVLDKTRPYLIPLKERLQLPEEMRARANPKSSTGRVDVFTRVISDRSSTFDEIAFGYRGRLYLEVVPLSFAVRVREDLTLNQLRLSVGQPRLTDAELLELHRRRPLLSEGATAVPDEGLAVSGGLFLGLNLKGDDAGRVGYRARANAPLLDLTKVREIDPEPYWEPVYKEASDRLVLAPKDFYLLMSNEAVTIPPTLAAEMTAYDPTSGELRTHYAGFFDPGFGYDDGSHSDGSTAALEVRAHDVAFMIEHRQRVCKLTFDRMLHPPNRLYGQGIGSSYQRQRNTLGKHFLSPSGPAKGRSARPRTTGATDQLALEVADDQGEPEDPPSPTARP